MITVLEGIAERNDISFADTVVLAGNVGCRAGGGRGRRHRRGAVHPGRGDATQEQTDVESFAWLEPKADGFRNYERSDAKLPAEYLLVDKANLLNLQRARADRPRRRPARRSAPTRRRRPTVSSPTARAS